MPALIALYRRITVWLRDAQVPGFTYTMCKFHPTCSEYAQLAVQRHGILKGTWLSVWRVLRCNPWSAGGIDYPS